MSKNEESKSNNEERLSDNDKSLSNNEEWVQWTISNQKKNLYYILIFLKTMLLHGITRLNFGQWDSMGLAKNFP